MAKWDELLEKLILTDTFNSQISTQGYYVNEMSYQDMIKKYNFPSNEGAANFLQVHFFSRQSKILRKNGFYLVLGGKGNFTIFEEQTFPRPYLDLDVKNVVELHGELSEYPELIDAFKARQENAGLEQLNALDGYDKLISELFGKTEWKIGPRGIQGSTFPVFFKDRNDQIKKIFDFNGRNDLDYSLWTKNHILAIEAKSTNVKKGLDVAWHKITYPLMRFIKYNNYKIKPVYFLRWGEIIHIFVFPNFHSHNHGIILNDKNMFKPEKIFKIKTM